MYKKLTSLANNNSKTFPTIHWYLIRFKLRRCYHKKSVTPITSCAKKHLFSLASHPRSLVDRQIITMLRVWSRGEKKNMKKVCGSRNGNPHVPWYPVARCQELAVLCHTPLNVTWYFNFMCAAKICCLFTKCTVKRITNLYKRHFLNYFQLFLSWFEKPLQQS